MSATTTTAAAGATTAAGATIAAGATTAAANAGAATPASAPPETAEAFPTAPLDAAIPADGGIWIWNRARARLEREVVLAEGSLRFLYGGSLGGDAARALLNKRPFSAVYGVWQRSRWSRRAIRGFVDALGIDLAEAELPLERYSSFDAFFTRRLRSGARPFERDPAVLPSPADARVLVFPRLEGTRLPVKGGGYTLAELLRDEAHAARYDGGAVVVLRLAPPDYHRFHFPDGGEAGPARGIDGLYDSVNPHALRRTPDLFCANQRAVARIRTDGFGELAFVEVGATCVGTIVQSYRPGRIRRGQEKGLFRFGGSTIVLALERGRLDFANDLLEHSARGLETLVRCGTPLGRRPRHGSRS